MSVPILKEIKLDVDLVVKDPIAESKEWLEQYNEERKNGPVGQWKKPCPECNLEVSKFLAECPGCGADLREKCEICGLPLSGEEPRCHCGGFESEEERQAFFHQSPRSRRANRPGGGSGHYWLRARRVSQGW